MRTVPNIIHGAYGPTCRTASTASAFAHDAAGGGVPTGPIPTSFPCEKSLRAAIPAPYKRLRAIPESFPVGGLSCFAGPDEGGPLTTPPVIDVRDSVQYERRLLQLKTPESRADLDILPWTDEPSVGGLLRPEARSSIIISGTGQHPPRGTTSFRRSMCKTIQQRGRQATSQGNYFLPDAVCGASPILHPRR